MKIGVHLELFEEGEVSERAKYLTIQLSFKVNVSLGPVRKPQVDDKIMNMLCFGNSRYHDTTKKSGYLRHRVIISNPALSFNLT